MACRCVSPGVYEEPATAPLELVTLRRVPQGLKKTPRAKVALAASDTPRRRGGAAGGGWGGGGGGLWGLAVCGGRGPGRGGGGAAGPRPFVLSASGRSAP